MKNALTIFVLLFLSILLGTSNNSNALPLVQAVNLQQELDTILAWFPGEYDNHQQIYKEAINKLPVEKRHRQTHHIFAEVELDFIPGRTLYAQQSQHYDLDDLYRQRIYAFEIDEKEQAIRLRIYTPKEPSKLKNAHLKPDALAQLSIEDFFLKPGCDVFWKRNGLIFKGYLKKNTCNYYSDRFGKQVYLNETLVLRKGALLLEDSATDSKGKPVFGVHEKGPTINLKEKSCK